MLLTTRLLFLVTAPRHRCCFRGDRLSFRDRCRERLLANVSIGLTTYLCDLLGVCAPKTNNNDHDMLLFVSAITTALVGHYYMSSTINKSRLQ